MNIINNKKTNWIVYTLCIVTLISAGYFVKPKKADAQLGGALGCKTNTSFSQRVPVQDNSTDAVKNVQCTWNGIAWQLARVALHSLTNSVVNWINTGFKGSPSFVTDTEGFFLDTADQMTGAFISNFGPLEELCSPFNLDIRLSLALGQSTTYPRYSCTLSEVIRTQKGNVQRLQDGTLVNVTVDQTPGGATIGDFQSGNILNNPNAVSINGSSIDGFVAGDFYQGGWPAFWAMTSDPQNTAMGASLKAQSDLQMQILAKQNTLNKDLDRGAGFLSWQKCEEVQTGAGPQEVCRNETPGSVISSQLNKQLGAPTDELNLTSEINQIVSALFSQLVTKVLNGGLLSSSQVDVKSGATQSVVNQLSNDPDLQANFLNLKQQAVDNFEEVIRPAETAAIDRYQALTNLVLVQTNYQATRACLASRAESVPQYRQVEFDYYKGNLSSIDLAIATNVTPKVNKYQDLSDSAYDVLAKLEEMKTALKATKSIQELSATSDLYSRQLSTMSSVATDPDAAKTDLATSVTETQSLENALKPFQSVCSNGYPMYGF